MILAAFMFISILSFTSCNDKIELPEIIFYGNFDKLKENVKFDFYIPTELPEGYLQTKSWTYEKNTITITYTNGERELILTIAKGLEANTDPEDIFNQITEKDMGGVTVRLLERFDAPICVNLTKFSIDKINYSLDSVTPEEAEVMISSMKPISQVSDYTSSIGSDTVKYNSLDELSSAFGIEIPFPSDITPSSYELLSGTLAQITFDFAGETYVFAVSKNSAAKDFYMYKSDNYAYSNAIVGNTELFVEIYGVTSEDEDTPNIIHMTAWTNDKASYVLHSSKGATEEQMIDVSIKFYEITPNTTVDESSIDFPIAEE